MIRVLIVEDSAVAREYLEHILNSDPDICVIGKARNGVDAMVMVEREKPDVITMDVNMPRMGGLEATRCIMETRPTPIIIVSASFQPHNVDKTFLALEAGAVAVVEKPEGPGHPNFAQAGKDLVQMVKLMSEVKVIRRWASTHPQKTIQPASEKKFEPATHDVQLIAIGASTGGPPALQTILSNLTKPLPVPVLIVQHIAAGFAHGFADWLMQSTQLPVEMAVNGEPLLAGQVHVAPDGWQMGLDSQRRISLLREDAKYGHCPSVSHLFRSVAAVYGRQAAAVLLTGMGRDGAGGLQLLRKAGALTIAQDAESSVIHGMPGEAIKLGAAMHILPPPEIAGLLNNVIRRSAEVVKNSVNPPTQP